jgi:transcriptional regulator with XRE-family HTH domain
MPQQLEPKVVRSTKPFPETLASIMEMEEISHRELARRCQRRGWGSLGTINQLVRGVLRPSLQAMKAVSTALQIEPETFAEYRLLVARRKLDPEVVGLAKALKNLEGCDF